MMEAPAVNPNEGLPWGVKYRVRRDAATPMYTTPITMDRDRFRTCTGDFALKIFKNLAMDPNRNAIIAPSLAEFPLLALLTVADGETRAEIKKAVGMEDVDDEHVHFQFQYAYYRLNQNGRRHDQWRPHGIKIWELHPVYLLLMKKSLMPTGDKWDETRARMFNGYKNVLHGVRLLREFNDRELKELDAFLSKETKKEFAEAFPAGSIQPPTNMAMVTGMSYCGTFINGFRVDTERESVFMASGVPVACRFICNETLKEYAEGDDCKVLGLEYCWGSLTLYMFLPKPGYDVEDIQDDMTAKKMTQLLKQAALHRVHKKYMVKYEVPFFRIHQSHDLTSIFREKLGLQSLFDASKINLKTFLTTTGLEQPSAMGPVQHHACLTLTRDYRGELNRFARPLREEIDIKGEESVDFIADRPFFFVIYDVRAQIFLYMGRLMNPNCIEDIGKMEKIDADAWA